MNTPISIVTVVTTPTNSESNANLYAIPQKFFLYKLKPFVRNMGIESHGSIVFSKIVSAMALGVMNSVPVVFIRVNNAVR